ncbi:MAG: DUF5116 domain-containing protein, partial [Bacteroidales bacterium]|nr:DUF5116 domain-containing protein [Bacteroidales bacterium]
KPASLFVVGGAIDDAWSLAIELPKKEEGVYEATEVELKLGKLEDNKGFKFLTAVGVWYPFYGQKVGESFGKTAIFATEADGDSQFYPLAAGFTSGKYTINVNLNTMVTTLTKTGEIYEFDKTTAIYIVGDGMTNSWDMVEANALVKVADSRYEAKNIRIAPDSKFKFSTWGWETEYVRKESAGSYWTAEVKTGSIGDVRFVPGDADAAFKTGEYTVSLDIKTGEVKLTLTKEEVVAKCIYIFGPATEAEWDTSKFIPMNEVSANVYEAKGVVINVGAANADDPKGNGFKFSETRGWDRQWGAKESFDGGYRGWEIGEMSSDANQFYPLLMSLSSGNYTVKVDLGSKTVTLTKE